MNSQKIWNNTKKSWNWIWNSNSILSWLVALVIIFVLVKFVFFPVMSLITGTSLPLAGVESSSMSHQIDADDNGVLNLCGNVFSADKRKSTDFEQYWNLCGGWYEEKNISKEEFSSFPLSNGFRKGDIIIVWGRFEPKIGDIIIFQAKSRAPRPIIHRIVNITNDIIQTKGDHNSAQLISSNNIYATDETHINKDQIIGKAVFRIPYLGWLKIWVTDFTNMILGR
jgi:hypothetical protein